MKCRRCLISGRVQGVWFRAATQQQARSLGLTGHALNMPDGSVEVLACGPSEALKRLENWLWRGPEQAQVSNVVCQDVAISQPLDDFTKG